MLDFKVGITDTDLRDAVNGNLIFGGSRRVCAVKIDSREVDPCDLFVAIKGEKTDGHKYINSAAESGASAILIDDPNVDLSAAAEYGCAVIQVENTVKALGLLAKKHKEELCALTVAVTGSVGKTTTRQFIYSVLASEKRTHKTEGNYNNEIGLPLTVCKQEREHEAVVLELGMSAKGEISYLTDIVKPDMAVITNIGTSHIEYLGSREGIRDAKLEITEGLKANGKLILNGDEPLLANIEGAVYVALKNPAADFRAVNICYTSEGMRFSALCPDRTISDCLIPTLGEHTVLDAMYAVACGYFAGISDDGIRKGLLAFETVGMRQNIITQNGLTYILDYYNASPESVKASLNVTVELARKNGGRAVAVLGNILELGKSSKELHRSIGEHLYSIGCDLLFTFGDDACVAAEEASCLGMNEDFIFKFSGISDPAPIAKAISENVKAGDCILIKASRSVHMERVADILLGI